MFLLFILDLIRLKDTIDKYTQILKVSRCCVEYSKFYH